jgi:hypothetical protein
MRMNLRGLINRIRENGLGLYSPSDSPSVSPSASVSPSPSWSESLSPSDSPSVTPSISGSNDPLEDLIEDIKRDIDDFIHSVWQEPITNAQLMNLVNFTNWYMSRLVRRGDIFDYSTGHTPYYDAKLIIEFRSRCYDHRYHRIQWSFYPEWATSITRYAERAIPETPDKELEELFTWEKEE